MYLVCHIKFNDMLICLQEENLQACLPLDYTADEYNYNNKMYDIDLWFNDVNGL